MVTRFVALVHKTASFFLDTLLPRRSRRTRIEMLSPEDIQTALAVHTHGNKSITSLLDYRTPIAKDLIRALKYDGSRHAARICAAILADYLEEELSALRTFSARPIYLVPVPLHNSRQRQRGFNQIEFVLSELPEHFKKGTMSAIAFDVLTRHRATAPQTKLSKGGRLSNMRGAFSLIEPSKVDAAHIYLIDDVVTTGATLMSALEPFQDLPASIHCIALAHA